MKALLRRATLLAFITVLCALPYNAKALSVSLTEDYANFTSNPGTTFNPVPAYSINTFLNIVGSTETFYRSPFENSGFSQGPGYNTLSYTAVQEGGLALYTFNQPQTSYTFLWGSPAPTDVLLFYSDPIPTIANLVYWIDGAMLGLDGVANGGHDWVNFQFSGGTFSSVLFKNEGLNSIEYTFLTPTPLPSTWLMLLSGFVGLGLLVYGGAKKRSATAPA